MKTMKYVLVFAMANLVSLAAFADQASDDAKLALLISDSSRLKSVNVSADDAMIKGEQVIDGDESSSTVVNVQLGGQLKTYVITRDGGGQIRSITLEK